MENNIMIGMAYLKRAGLEDWQINALENRGYFRAPASKGHHLVCSGGLVTHSINVTNRLVKMTETIGVDWRREESPYLVGMLHDLVKMACYRLENEPARDGGRERFEYVQPAWPGHGLASVMIATAELGIDLDEKETAAILWHMGAFGLDAKGLKEYDAALDKWPKEIIAAHTADILAARVDEGWETPSGSSARQDGGRETPSGSSARQDGGWETPSGSSARQDGGWETPSGSSDRQDGGEDGE